MNRFALFLIIVLVSVFSLATPANASLGLHDGDIAHYAPDDGLDPPIRIRCDFGKAETGMNLYEGEDSRQSNRCGDDTDQVYVRPGEEIWCKFPNFPDPAFWMIPRSNDPGSPKMDATGWYKINGLWSDGYGCTIRAD